MPSLVSSSSDDRHRAMSQTQGVVVLNFAEGKELYYDTTAASASPSTQRDVVSIPVLALVRM